jgi:acyl-CoA thioester hydrolase
MSGAAANWPELPPATERSSYTIWTRDTLRYGDTDRQGHINNAVYATFCESGRVAFLYDETICPVQPGANFVIVRLELDYRAELYYPGAVDIGTRVLAIGTRSFRIGQAVFKEAVCAATAECVMVLMDDTTRKAVPLSDTLRAWLSARLARGSAPIPPK